MKKIILLLVFLPYTMLFCSITTMNFNGTSTTVAGVEFSFSIGTFENGGDGTAMSLFDNHPYANMINGGEDYKDIFISESILITSVNASWATNVQGFKLQFLNNGTVVKELSSLTVGDVAVNITANKIRYLDSGASNSGGFELASVSWDNPLPVELVSFEAKLLEKSILLEWDTATEINNYGFDVERQQSELRSNNSDWEKLGFIEGHGTSNSLKKYSFIDKSLETSGKYCYRLKQVDIDGNFEYSNIVEINLSKPLNFVLDQNYPNPFNPTTSISYSIPEYGYVTLGIYDVLGDEVVRLEDTYKSAGNYVFFFDASKLTSGVYFCTIKSGKFVQTKKMSLMK